MVWSTLKSFNRNSSAQSCNFDSEKPLIVNISPKIGFSVPWTVLVCASQMNLSGLSCMLRHNLVSCFRSFGIDTFRTRITCNPNARWLIWYCKEKSKCAPVNLIWCLDCRNNRNRRGLSSGDWRLESRDPSILEPADLVDGGTFIASRSIELELGLRDKDFFGGVQTAETRRSGGLTAFVLIMPILDALRFNSDPSGVSWSS